MQVIHVYKATENSDSVEGRGIEVLLGYFAHYEDADRAIKGNPTGNVERADLTIYDSYKEFAERRDSALRQNALAKLSAEERRALGV